MRHPDDRTFGAACDRAYRALQLVLCAPLRNGDDAHAMWRFLVGPDRLTGAASILTAWPDLVRGSVH